MQAPSRFLLLDRFMERQPSAKNRCGWSLPRCPRLPWHGSKGLNKVETPGIGKKGKHGDELVD